MCKKNPPRNEELFNHTKVLLDALHDELHSIMLCPFAVIDDRQLAGDMFMQVKFVQSLLVGSYGMSQKKKVC